MRTRTLLCLVMAMIASCGPATAPVEHVEAMSFRLKGEVTAAEFASVNEKVAAFLSAQPGFISRQLGAVGDTVWFDVLQWKSRADFERAFELSASDPAIIRMTEMIDMESIQPFSFRPAVSTYSK